MDGITNIYLYVESDSIGNSKEAIDFLNTNNVPFTLMYYGNTEQHELVFNALNTWWPGEVTFDSFPFIIYSVKQNNVPEQYWQRKYIIGLDNIKKSNIVEMSQL